MKETVEKKAFNLKTHIRSADGKVEKINLYRLVCKQDSQGNSIKLFERPVDSGMFYYENGDLAKAESKDALEKLAKAEAKKEEPKAEVKKEEKPVESKKL